MLLCSITCLQAITQHFNLEKTQSGEDKQEGSSAEATTQQQAAAEQQQVLLACIVQ